MIEQAKGYVQVYTGDGKGKTTAAMGLALRAAGAGKRVFIAQFLKAPGSSECIAFLPLSDSVTFGHYGTGRLLKEEPTEQDRVLARKGLEEARRAMHSGEYAVVILDEANVAVHFGLLSAADLLDFIREKPGELELVITGRKADQRVIEAADLVTEMREIKHYYALGVKARKGIES